VTARNPIPIPRLGEEPVFEAPWEGRAFALVMSLHEQGVFTWEAFQSHLVNAIRDWERDPPPGEAYSYYRQWYRALETLLEGRALCDPADLDARVAELGRRNPGHDHVARREPLVVSKGKG